MAHFTLRLPQATVDDLEQLAIDMEDDPVFQVHGSGSKTAITRLAIIEGARVLKKRVKERRAIASSDSFQNDPIGGNMKKQNEQISGVIEFNGREYPRTLAGEVSRHWDKGREYFTINVRCDWCNRTHIHGLPDYDPTGPIRDPEHRTAHCRKHPPGPYDGVGYFIQPT